MKKLFDGLVDFLFIKEEYKVKFQSAFFKKLFRFGFLIVFGFFFVIWFLVWCMNQVFGQMGSAVNFFGFFVIVSLFYPLFLLFRFFVRKLVPSVNFGFNVGVNLYNFVVGNRFYDDKMSYKPEIFYKYDYEFLIVRFKLDGHSVTKKFRDLGEQLSSMFVLPLSSKDEVSGYMVYKFRIREIEREHVSNIIKSDEIRFIKDSIVFNEELIWNYRKCPHGLITGITGSGKTYLFAYFIIIFLKVKAKFKIVDPKRADLYYLSKYFGKDVVYEKNHGLRLLRESCDLIDQRMEDFQNRSNYKWGEDYSYYDEKPYFLIFDEVAVFASSLKGKDKVEYEENLVKIILEGRQAGVFIILAMQRPDVDFVPGPVRDQLGLRIALGRMSPTGYKMVFGEEGKDLKLENKLAGFYMDLQMHIPEEFFTPYLNIDFIDVLEKLIDYKEEKIILDEKLD